MFDKMQPMDTAPQDRPILVKVNNSGWMVHNHGYEVVLYTLSRGRESWVSNESAFSLRDNDLLGWWELPE